MSNLHHLLIFTFIGNGYIENQELDSFVRELFECMQKDTNEKAVSC